MIDMRTGAWCKYGVNEHSFLSRYGLYISADLSDTHEYGGFTRGSTS
jgi:hypothetical protein